MKKLFTFLLVAFAVAATALLALPGAAGKWIAVLAVVSVAVVSDPWV